MPAPPPIALAPPLRRAQDQRAKLSRQLKEAQRQEEALLDKVHGSESARQEQELRLEAASEQVAAMRGELQLLQAKLAARDQQLLRHVKEVRAASTPRVQCMLCVVQGGGAFPRYSYRPCRRCRRALPLLVHVRKGGAGCTPAACIPLQPCPFAPAALWGWCIPFANEPQREPVYGTHTGGGDAAAGAARRLVGGTGAAASAGGSRRPATGVAGIHPPGPGATGESTHTSTRQVLSTGSQ